MTIIDKIKGSKAWKKGKGKAYLIDLRDELKVPVDKLYAAVMRASGMTSDRIVVTTLPNQESPGKTKTIPAVSIIGVISDTHYGSKYCAREQIKDFVSEAYSHGARTILHPGDIVDGIYHHGRYEVSHAGLADQVGDMIDNLPKMDGLRYIGITGNHDHTFAAACGVDMGHYITSTASKAGRDDISIIGQRSGYVKVGNVNVHMWHPMGSPGYAVSYKLQKKIEGYEPGCKPDILLVGHWHRQGYVQERGVHAFACPSFQFGGSDFANSLVADSKVGGILLGIKSNDSGLDRLSMTFKNYYRTQTVWKVRDRSKLEVSNVEL